MISAFGVDHGEISKADGEFRDSYLNSINPRSDTKVKRGSAPRRYLKAYGGAAGGALLGSVAGRAAGSPALASALSLGGGIAGATAGRTSNLKRGDVVATNRKTGKKAKSYVGHLSAGGYTYQ